LYGMGAGPSLHTCYGRMGAERAYIVGQDREQI